MEIEQGLADGLGNEAADFGFAMEFDLALGGVDVHVHRRRRDFQKKTANRVAAFHQGSVVAFEQGEVQAAILHRAAVDKEVLVFARRARHAGSTDEPPDAERDGRWPMGGC